MIKPGGTIGILGGGQLGRMMAMSAAQLGYHCITYSPERDSVAAEVCSDFFCNKWDDRAALAAFAQKCDVITWEFENVPVAPLQPIKDQIFPHPRALETAQDRLAEKRFVEKLGGTPAAFATIDSHADLITAVDRIGAPGILKTRRDGYDGKGQWRVDSSRDAEGLRLPDTATIYEGFVEFFAEFSVILVRGQDGEVRFWDSAENLHEDGVLAASTLPASTRIQEQVEPARKLAASVAQALNYVGVLTCEFFATHEGPIFNEMAPRVHNSGHWSIEGAATSQFENHIRAICGLPLGDTATIAPHVAMRNIIGKEAKTAQDMLAEPNMHLHLYGKRHARDGRKMGHATKLVWDAE
ncbi:5-(carboxyamino)imidazole ribonucleotide synthase [Pontixanthobacter aestiaquae]|uniref:N5-carboxyaminoimidazole ribonucleotide synthase n=1 Tax=Pontixanthobacter aestiaquae TaxID=1509367 RepID=A0A844Z256_9SPHN|nr:5-(carboxyamino)imidazole ribonucleotide synthase [Pontixanthobacter aestiaquae]MDN3646994.1 5-(carboxyamino)imidazole ribonucleotide synthase [Pontixanthobacter aestiaquae]MXO82025.1 5-(carboxyamino)imidazole ribonucleotide synthase [Pontixanthobacter aestiaquae]